MKDSSNDTRLFTAADIRRYIDGTMPPAEMHALEKAALDDPFLADALEGWQEAIQAKGPERVEQGLEDLRKTFAESSKDKKPAPVVPLRTNRWWTVAAAAVVVLIGAAVLYSTVFRTEKQEDTIAVVPATETTTPPDGQTVPPPTPSQAEKPASPSITTPQKSPDSPIKASEPTTTKNTQSRKEEDLVSNKAGKQLDKEEIGESKKAEPAAAPVAARDITLEAKEKTETAAPLLNSFAGKVTDQNNQPIANATVRISNTNNGIITDANGEFRLKSADSVLPVEVMVVGYASREAKLSKDLSLNRIQLPEASASLNEVVVTGKAENAKTSERSRYLKNSPKVMVQDAEPSNGWIDFDKYLQQALVFSETNKLPHGEAVVSFLVNKAGEISSFRIEQSLSPVQDAEARRLIESGPSWRLLKGKKARVTVIIRF